MIRIMSPRSPSLVAGQVPLMVSIAVEEGIVDENSTAKPVGAPSPSVPAAPTAKTKGKVKTGSKAEAEIWVIERRIETKGRRTPDKERIINRHVNHFRIRRQDFNRALSILIRVSDCLLWS